MASHESQAPTPLAIEARRLGRRFGRHWALARLDLEVEAGARLLVAGANGSGKTTFLRLVASLYRPSAGSLRIFGMDPDDQRLGCRRAVSLVSHDNYLYNRLTALETVRLWARLLGRGTRDRDLLPLLEEVDLARRKDARVGGFSAGMRKRLTLLRVRLEGPRLVLLDEPFAALDASGQRLVEDWIRSFHTEGATVVMASHAVERAARLCDRGFLLRQGQMVWRGAAQDLAARMEEALA